MLVTLVVLYYLTTYIVYLGLPNALGGYDETPEVMAAHLKVLYLFVCVCIEKSLCSLLHRMVYWILLEDVVGLPLNLSSKLKMSECDFYLGYY